MAKTDTTEEALAKNVATDLSFSHPEFSAKDASFTQMSFFTREEIIMAQLNIQIDESGGDGKVKYDPVHVHEFAIEDALPADLFEAAKLIQVYLHNYAVEQANS